MDRDSPAFGYVVAIVATVAMVGLRWALTPWLGDNLPFITLFGAIAAAVWFGGYRPALIAAIGGYLVVNYVFVAPHWEFATESDESRVGFVLFLLTSAIIVGLGERMRAAQRWAKERLELLRVTFASISVDDDGQGIPAELLPRLFEPFVQGEADRASGGLGLGLALSNRLATMHGGSLAARSDGPGRGSCFVVRLPRVVQGTNPAR